LKEWDNRNLADFYFLRDNDFKEVSSCFSDWVDEAKTLGYHLLEQELQGRPDNHVEIFDDFNNVYRKVLNFSSYNYLGLSYHPDVIQAAIKSLSYYGLGASGSPILSGTFKIHNDFAKDLADFKQTESVLLYPSGYSGNVGAISALLKPGDVAFVDKYIHASIVDGIQLSRAKARYFNHNDTDQLDYYLNKENDAKRKLIIVEGVYSMDGTLSNLPEIVPIARKHKAVIMIDEAHSTLVFGKNGRGVAEHFGLEKEIDISFGTLSKSFGGIGGFIAGNKELIEYIKFYSRSRFFSCSLPPGITAGLREALHVYIKTPELKNKLWENIDYSIKSLRAKNIDIGDTQSQVIPIMINNDKIIFELGRKILNQNLFVQPVTYPAVKKNKSRFRISITATHSKTDIDNMVTILANCLKEYNLI